MPLENCLTEAGKLLKEEERKKLLEDRDNLVKSGLDLPSAERKVKNDFVAKKHEELFNRLNDLKVKAKVLKPSEVPAYKPHDASEQVSAIHQKYDAQLLEHANELRKKYPNEVFKNKQEPATAPQPKEVKPNEADKSTAVKPADAGKEQVGKPVYSAVFVDDAEELKKKFPPVHPNEYYHHSTIEFKPKDLSGIEVGKDTPIKITGRLTTDKVDVLLVDNPKSKNKTAHITLSTAEGVKPAESNSELEKHKDKIQHFEEPITIKGVEGFSDGKNDITSEKKKVEEPKEEPKKEEPKKVEEPVEEAAIAAAPYRAKNVSTLQEDADIRDSPEYKQHQENIRKIAESLGIQIKDNKDTWGGYVDSETGKPVQEVSNVISINTTHEKAVLMAALIGKTAPEEQDSVLLGSHRPGGEGTEYTIHTGSFGNAEKALEYLKKNGLEYFTIDKKTGDISILDLDNGNHDKITNFVDELQNNNLNEGTEASTVHATFVSHDSYDGIVEKARDKTRTENGFDLDAFIKEAAGSYAKIKESSKEAPPEPVVATPPTEEEATTTKQKIEAEAEKIIKFFDKFSIVSPEVKESLKGAEKSGFFPDMATAIRWGAQKIIAANQAGIDIGKKIKEVLQFIKDNWDEAWGKFADVEPHLQEGFKNMMKETAQFNEWANFAKSRFANSQGVLSLDDFKKQFSEQFQLEESPEMDQIYDEGKKRYEEARKVPLGDFIQNAAEEETPDEGEGKKFVGIIPALKDYLVANFSQLGKLSQESKDKAASYFAASTQAAAILKQAVFNITKEIGKQGWDELRKVLVQSRLDGIRQRWKDMSSAAEVSTDKEIFQDRKHLGELLDNIAARTPLDNLRNDFNSLLEQEDFDQAREFLRDAFASAADRITGVDFSAGRSYDEITKDKKFQNALDIYKRTVEKPIAENHAANEGIFSDALGELQTYYPLIPIDDKGEVIRPGNAKLKSAENMQNRMATGLANEYDVSIQAFSRQLESAFRSNNKSIFMDTLRDAALIKDLAPFEKSSHVLYINDIPYSARAVVVSEAYVKVINGKRVDIPERRALIPDWLYTELKPMLSPTRFDKEGKPIDISVMRKILDKTTAFALGGIFEPAIHYANLTSALVNGTPYPGTSLLSKTVGNLPVTKVFTSMFNMATEDVSSEKAILHIQDMAKIGLISPRTGEVTWSKKYAAATGAEKVRLWNLSPFLYGRKGMDLKGRVLMDRICLEINPNATPEERRQFTFQMGNYVKGMEGQLERSLKSTGLAPFYTAASTMLKNGIKGWLGKTPLPTGNMTFLQKASYRAAQMLSAGAVGITGLWIAAYKAQTGNLPWNDNNSNFLRIPLTEAQKAYIGNGDHPVLFKLFYRDGKWQDINIGFFNRALDRGAKGLALPAIYNTTMQGGTKGQIVDAAVTQSLNAFVQPMITSPALHLGATALMGSAPYLTGVRAQNGSMAPQFLQTVRTYPGMAQYGANTIQAAENLNPLIGMIASETGMSFRPSHDKEDEESVNYLKMITELCFPNMFSPHIDNAKSAYFLKKGLKAEIIKSAIQSHQAEQSPFMEKVEEAITNNKKTEQP